MCAIAIVHCLLIPDVQLEDLLVEDRADEVQGILVHRRRPSQIPVRQFITWYRLDVAKVAVRVKFSIVGLRCHLLGRSLPQKTLRIFLLDLCNLSIDLSSHFLLLLFGCFHF